MQRIGVIGAGQLGQMLGFAGRSLDLRFTFLDPAPNPPAAAAGRIICRPFDDQQGLADLAAESDLVTYEFENVPVAAVKSIADQLPVYPPAEALAHAQDRLAEKRLFSDLGIPIPGWHAVDAKQDVDTALQSLGAPLVLKTRRLGYDGKGQFLVRGKSDIEPAWKRIGGKPLIAERWVQFDCEVSAIGVRNVSGQTAYYPLTENRHRNGILRESRAPWGSDELTATANDYVQRLLNRLQYVGVLALEMFVVDGRLLANEFAPRVHNSGHWTIDGANTSQFENHLRAMLDLPPGDTAPAGHAGMLNLIGSLPGQSADEWSEQVVWHDYGKEPRPGRKLGHINVIAASADQREIVMDALLRTLAA